MVQRENLKKISIFIITVSMLYIVLMMFVCSITSTTDFFHAKKIVCLATLWTISSKLCKNSRGFWFSNAGIFALLSSVLVINYFANDSIPRAKVITYLSFAGSLSCLLTMLPMLFPRKSFHKLSGLLILLPVVLIVMLFWGYYFTSNAWFSSDTMLAIMQTNFSESKEFIKDYFNAKVLFSCLILILGMFAEIKVLANNTLRNRSKIFLFTSILICIGSILLLYKTRVNIVTDIGIKAKQNLKSYNDFRKKMAQRKNNISVKGTLKHNGDKGIYVLVIGESQNKNHMSAYGYQKDTTPWLKAMMNSKNTLVFNEVYSCHTHTVPVLTYALTAKNQYNSTNLSEAVSILEVAEAVGYETTWLSNQVKYGAWDTPITVIASEANQQVWINKNLGETTETNAFDIKLVDALEHIKYTDKMLLIIHLMGNHGSYAQRYPKSFSKFGDKKTIDHYDNSMLYNDYVVSRIYEKVKTIPYFQAMIYCADHADAVDQNLAHDASRFVWSMTEVPMYMIFSESFVIRNKSLIDNLRMAEYKMFTNDLLYNLLMGVLGIKNITNYEPYNDITNENYDANKERFKTLYGKKKLSERKD